MPEFTALNPEIENEVQARVEFKFNEFMAGMKNRAGLEWGIAFNSMSQKHTFYWEAFEEMIKMVNKEINMGYPRDRMHQQKVWEHKEKAVNNIMKRLEPIMRGNMRAQEIMHIQRFIANEISEAQNF